MLNFLDVRFMVEILLTDDKYNDLKTNNIFLRIPVGGIGMLGHEGSIVFPELIDNIISCISNPFKNGQTKIFGTLRSTNHCSSTPTVVMASLWSVSRLLRTQRSSQLLHRFHGTLTTARINHTDKEISFADHRATYAHLSASEILRAWFVLKLCSFDFVVQNSIKVTLSHSNRYLTNRLICFMYFVLFFRFWNTVSVS